MDLDTLWTVAERARTKQRLTPSDVAFVRQVVPEEFEAVGHRDVPKTSRHPAGFTITGVPVRTFLRSALLLAGQRVLGSGFGNSSFYETLEKDLAFGIMRSHFHRGFPKGTYCCVQCSLAVYPVLEAGAIRYFDCAPLARDVRRLIVERKWRFARPPHARMVAWSLGTEPPRRVG